MKILILSLPISIASTPSLRGQVGGTSQQLPNSQYLDAMGARPPDFNCFRGAWHGENAEVTCNESKAKDDSPCVWCSNAKGKAAGACLSNDEAIMANGSFGLTCPLSIYLEPAENKMKQRMPDVNCFKAAWVAENAESACEESKDKDGNGCTWCQTGGDVAGVCLSKLEAGMADGQFGLKCPSSVADHELAQ